MWNNPGDKVKEIIPPYSLTLRRIIVFSTISQVIIKATVFSFILFVASSETSRNRAPAILKISDAVL